MCLPRVGAFLFTASLQLANYVHGQVHRPTLNVPHRQTAKPTTYDFSMAIAVQKDTYTHTHTTHTRTLSRLALSLLSVSRSPCSVSTTVSCFLRAASASFTWAYRLCSWESRWVTNLWGRGGEGWGVRDFSLLFH